MPILKTWIVRLVFRDKLESFLWLDFIEHVLRVRLFGVFHRF